MDKRRKEINAKYGICWNEEKERWEERTPVEICHKGHDAHLVAKGYPNIIGGRLLGSWTNEEVEEEIKRREKSFQERKRKDDEERKVIKEKRVARKLFVEKLPVEIAGFIKIDDGEFEDRYGNWVGRIPDKAIKEEWALVKVEKWLRNLFLE